MPAPSLPNRTKWTGGSLDFGRGSSGGRCSRGRAGARGGHFGQQLRGLRLAETPLHADPKMRHRSSP